MKKIFTIITIICLSSFANADIQDQLKTEYGTCYNNFIENLQSCKKSSCTYPDPTDAKSWRAHIINGMVGKQCYVIYYSFLGSEITSNPDHCFYDKDRVSQLVEQYRKLFKVGSLVDVMAIREQINYLTYDGCKKKDDQQNTQQ